MIAPRITTMAMRQTWGSMRGELGRGEEGEFIWRLNVSCQMFRRQDASRRGLARRCQARGGPVCGRHTSVHGPTGLVAPAPGRGGPVCGRHTSVHGPTGGLVAP